MRLILYLLLFVAISSFADSTKKILPLEIGGILKLSDIDKEEANLEYQIAQKRKGAFDRENEDNFCGNIAEKYPTRRFFIFFYYFL
jgi:hypothetical protein